MLTVGLTGGIGSGKSTVADYFKVARVPVVDADEAARACTQPGSAVLKAIKTRLGAHFLDHDGQLRRTALAAYLFKPAHQADRLWLEALLHPLIWAHMRAQSCALSGVYCLWVLPLWVELQHRGVKLDRLLVVDAPEALQFVRARRCTTFDRATIEGIMRRQATRKERFQWADDVIDNNRDVPYLKAQVQKLHRFYLDLAKKSACVNPK